MKIKNIDFTNCFLASGSLNFFGNGYWYGQWLKCFIPGFRETISKTTFVAKTVTLKPRLGNMPLDKNFQPEELIPSCIKVYPFQGIILNSVGLSNPGIGAILKTDCWQNFTKPFFISLMAIEDTPLKRMEEIKKFVDILGDSLSRFRTKIGVQVNVSCPNLERHTGQFSEEALTILSLVLPLQVPIDLKVNTFISNELIAAIEKNKFCDVLTISNTIPYGSPGIDWQKIFGAQSPLKKYGGGGLSGKLILPIVLKKIAELREAGITMPIKGSGGILSPNDVNCIKKAGANAIEIGSALILKPWLVPAIIQRANQIF